MPELRLGGEDEPIRARAPRSHCSSRQIIAGKNNQNDQDEPKIASWVSQIIAHYRAAPPPILDQRPSYRVRARSTRPLVGWSARGVNTGRRPSIGRRQWPQNTNS